MQAEPFVAGARRFDFDQNLAPYNLHAYHQWQSLSSYISKGVTNKLSPLPSGNISITAEGDPAHLKPVTPAEKKLYAQLQQGRSQATSAGGYSTVIPKFCMSIASVCSYALSNQLVWATKHTMLAALYQSNTWFC